MFPNMETQSHLFVALYRNHPYLTSQSSQATQVSAHKIGQRIEKKRKVKSDIARKGALNNFSEFYDACDNIPI